MTDAYMCPHDCGCLWRDNKDGTMSLFGPNSKSCEKCEFLPLPTCNTCNNDGTDCAALSELDLLREYAALCRKAVEAANDYRHAVNEGDSVKELEGKFTALYDAIWNHAEDNLTLAHIDRIELADSTRTQEKP